MSEAVADALEHAGVLDGVFAEVRDDGTAAVDERVRAFLDHDRSP